MTQYSNSENGQTETQVVDATNSPFSLPSGQNIVKVVVENAASAAWKGDSTQGPLADFRAGSDKSYESVGAYCACLPGQVIFGSWSEIDVDSGQVRVFGAIL
jgi:hypothetical protein